MLFDAPESSRSPDTWLMFYVYATLPLVFGLAIPLAIVCFRKPKDRHMMFLAAPFATWAVAATS